MTDKLKIDYIPATELKPNPKNPRKNDAAVGKLDDIWEIVIDYQVMYEG